MISLGGKEIPEETVSKLLAKQYFLYCFGEVRYRDAFGKTHSTKFRVMIDDIQSGSILIYHEGNKAT
jgi:hypothetical protein